MQARRAAWLLAAGLLAAGLAGGRSLAQEGDDAGREAALARLRQEIEGLQGQLALVQGSARSVADRLARTEIELALQEARFAEARTARDLASARLAATSARVVRLESELERARRSLGQQLRGLYRLGRLGYLRLLTSLEPGSDPLEAIRTLRYLARRDAKAIDGFVATRDGLALEQRLQATEQEEVARWAAQEEARRQELAVVRSRQASLLGTLQAEQRRLVAEAARLADKERKLSSLLENLSGDAPSELAGTPIQQYKGVLDWPVEGEVLVEFGPVLDPRYRTQLPHNGIDVGFAGDREVRAVYPGEVLFAGPFEGYGSMVVVLHPGRVFSIYTGLATVKVAKGDVLSLESVVGAAADRLYFELRVDNRPQDPLDWLR